MAIKNNYWKTTLSKQGFNIYAGKEGWEIRYRPERENRTTEKVTLVACKPKGMSKEAKADLQLKFKKLKLVAQSVETRDEYEKLRKRIDGDWEYVFKNNLKDHDLVKWAYTTPTSEEYRNSLWHG